MPSRSDSINRSLPPARQTPWIKVCHTDALWNVPGINRHPGGFLKIDGGRPPDQSPGAETGGDH